MYYTDFDKYVADLEDMLWDDPDTALAMGLGHSTIHMRGDENTKSMVSRMLDEGVKGSGSFLGGQEEATMNIQQAALYESNTIAEWVLADKSAFKTKESYEYLAISVDMDPSATKKHSVVTGIGLKYDESTGDILEMKSHGVRLVLKRDRDCIFGFHLRTAYADHRIAEPTGVRYTKDDILVGKFYEFPNRLSLAYFANKNDNVLTFYGEDRDHRPYIRVVHKHSKYSAYIKETETKYYNELGGERVRVEKDEVLSNAPDMESAVTDIEDIAITKEKLKINGKEMRISDLTRNDALASLKEKAKKKWGSNPNRKLGQNQSLSTASKPEAKKITL